MESRSDLILHSRGRPRKNGLRHVLQPRQRLNKLRQNSTATAVAKPRKILKSADDRGYARFNRCRGWSFKIRGDELMLFNFSPYNCPSKPFKLEGFLALAFTILPSSLTMRYQGIEMAPSWSKIFLKSLSNSLLTRRWLPSNL